ncbi:hypothetical protein CEQ90_05770 [Lewinellaceae bacterium SD302]|nr:hypothetical protein CEQ90_05770 [Lewinellaceae bacterium SD302]
MKKSWLVATMIFLLIIVMSNCDQTSDPNVDVTETELTETETDDQHNYFPEPDKYPDFGYMISAEDLAKDYPDAEVFKLSQDYPAQKPGDDQIPDFFDIDFTDDAHWREYIDAVRDYCFEGMMAAGFDANKNQERNWYHMPFMHWGPQGTEGFSGLAKEAQISPYQLTPAQKGSHQTYALGYYNEFAGYTLHEMWGDPRNPNPQATSALAGGGGGFPVGTVIFKLLYTDADETEVDYLTNPYTIKGYVTDVWDSDNRVVKNMQLIQMDFMVRDPRADAFGTGWVFGTFCYNGKLNDGKTGVERVKNLVPVGIQYGNDPDVTTNKITAYPPLETWINPELKETKINANADELPPQHLGWGGRLDGPVDLNTASCMSCHATAGFPQSTAALVPKEAFIGDRNAQGSITKLTNVDAPEWKKYYTNIKCGTPYDVDAISCDFSLQVSLALGYYYDWKVNEDGKTYADYQKSGSTPDDDNHPEVAHRGADAHLEAHNLKK